MRDIPEEARFLLAGLKDGLTEKQYVDAIWHRRQSEHRCKSRSRWKWPMIREAIPSKPTATITRIDSKRKK